MQDNPDYELQLDGHADWIGTVEYNLALSERRAKQAYEYLTQKGIPTRVWSTNFMEKPFLWLQIPTRMVRTIRRPSAEQAV